MITVVTPVSPIPSHPSVHILTETIETVRQHLPDAEIILTFDGVRREQEHRRADYEEHIRKVLALADRQWGNVCPFIFDRHTHQVGMMRAVIDEIHTPLMLYVEQDTPLTPDREIPWELLCDKLSRRNSNMIRLHHEDVIPEEHNHMMHGIDGEFTRTSQWSQRPHLATVDFYRDVLSNFTPDALTFIEDKMHGIVSEAFIKAQMAGWAAYRLHIYTPQGGIKRTYHLDGRAGEEKYDDKLVF